MTVISSIRAREILDSRGYPTIEVDVALKDGSRGRASAPSGASKGRHEAFERRDGGARYLGKGVLQAVEAVNGEIAEALSGYHVEDQAVIDRALIMLDADERKARLGANAILCVSLAVAKAASAAWRLPLYRYIGGQSACVMPTPMLNVINGGAHADTPLDIQEFMIVPAGRDRFSEALRAGSEIFHTLKRILRNAGHETNVGDEGGFAPRLRYATEVLDLLLRSIEESGYRPGEDVFIALDIAATELYDEGNYRLKGEGQSLDRRMMTEYLAALVGRYPILSVEDGMAEDDWEGWEELTSRLGDRVQLVGDDVFVTHSRRLATGIERKVANAVLIKVNQVGTLTETLETIEMAHRSSYKTIMSHRSGETEDTTIADLAVAFSTRQVKMGSVSRSDRLAKYNQLLRIEEELGEDAVYAGLNPFKGKTSLSSC